MAASGRGAAALSRVGMRALCRACLPQPFLQSAALCPRAGDALIQQELDSLVRARGFTPRDFVRTAVGSGFAAAVLPVTAQT
jgi:hypothetical protein